MQIRFQGSANIQEEVTTEIFDAQGNLSFRGKVHKLAGKEETIDFINNLIKPIKSKSESI